MSEQTLRITYRYRVKNLEGELNRQARAVNSVWNYCNDVQKSALRWGKRWPSAFDLMKLTAGSSKELGLSANAIACVCKGYEKSRRQTRRPYLRYRGRHVLGWVPFRAADLRLVDGGYRFYGRLFRVFHDRQLPAGAHLTDGSSFAQDAEGKWYLNLCLSIPMRAKKEQETAVGIDLGLKALATLSNGELIDHPRFYRQMQQRIARANRAHKFRRLKRLHAICANSRRDYIHKTTKDLAERFDKIAVGGVQSSSLGRTRMAKSIYDAGWAIFKNQLRYKTIALGGTYVEVDESFTTQTCSDCGVVGGPKGRKGLGVRQWECSACGASHQRDVNSALNILARSRHGTPTKGAARCGSVDER